MIDFRVATIRAGDMVLRDTLNNPLATQRATNRWSRASSAALYETRGDNQVEPCDDQVDDGFIKFLVEHFDGRAYVPYGVWALYAVRILAEDQDRVRITARIAPMLHRPGTRQYWRDVRLLMSHFLGSRGVALEDGRRMRVRDFTFPSEDRGDPEQHEWPERDIRDLRADLRAEGRTVEERTIVRGERTRKHLDRVS